MPTVRLHPPPAASRVRETPQWRVPRAGFAVVVTVAVCIHPVSGWLRRCISAQMPGASAVTWPNSPKRRSPAESTSSTRQRLARRAAIRASGGAQELEALEVLADAARRHDAGGQRPRRHRGRCPRRRAASGPGRPAAVDRARHHRPAPGDRPVHSRPPAGHRRGRRVRRLLLRRPVLADPDEARPTRARSGPGPCHRRIGNAKPWFAIGGIDEQRLPEVLEAGARRIVVVRAIAGADDPEAAAWLKARLVEAG